jgi:hypothetical protein
MNTAEDAPWFKRDMVGPIFGKKCLRLKSACWMNPWALIEQFPTNKTDKKIEIYVHHMYCRDFSMNNHLRV